MPFRCNTSTKRTPAPTPEDVEEPLLTKPSPIAPSAEADDDDGVVFRVKHISAYVCALQSLFAAVCALCVSALGTCLFPGSATRTLVLYIGVLQLLTVRCYRDRAAARMLHGAFVPLGWAYVVYLTVLQLEASVTHEDAGSGGDDHLRGVAHVATLSLLLLAAADRALWPRSAKDADIALAMAAAVVAAVKHPSLDQLDGSREPLCDCGDPFVFGARCGRMLAFLVVAHTTTICAAPRRLTDASTHSLFAHAVAASAWTLAVPWYVLPVAIAQLGVMIARRSHVCAALDRGALVVDAPLSMERPLAVFARVVEGVRRVRLAFRMPWALLHRIADAKRSPPPPPLPRPTPLTQLTPLQPLAARAAPPPPRPTAQPPPRRDACVHHTDDDDVRAALFYFKTNTRHASAARPIY